MKELLNTKILISIILFIFIIVIVNFIKKYYNTIIKKVNNTKKKTIYNVLASILCYGIIIIGIIFILQFNGINVTGLVAGLGLVSIITGLALQDALKDIIMGINIIIDNYYNVGDVIKLDNIEGKVLSFNLKCTKIMDIDTKDIYIISNRNIDKAIKISNQFDIDIPLEYEENIKKIEKVINIIIEESKKNNDIIDIKYMGLNKFDTSSINYKIRIWCNETNKPIIKRYVNKIIKEVLDKNKIVIPYTKIIISK